MSVKAAPCCAEGAIAAAWAPDANAVSTISEDATAGYQRLFAKYTKPSP
jgi:hypothetical protein